MYVLFTIYILAVIYLCGQSYHHTSENQNDDYRSKLLNSVN